MYLDLCFMYLFRFFGSFLISAVVLRANKSTARFLTAHLFSNFQIKIVQFRSEIVKSNSVKRVRVYIWRNFGAENGLGARKDMIPEFSLQ